MTCWDSFLTDSVPPELNRSDKLILAQAPGKAEMLQQRPLVGPSGRLLDWALRKCRLRRRDFDLDNVCRTRLPSDAREALFKQTQKRLKAHPDWPELCSRTNAVVQQYRFVLALGETPLVALFGPEYLGIDHFRGYLFELNGVQIIPTVHPARCLPGRFPAHKWLLTADISKAHTLWSYGRNVEPFQAYIPDRGWIEETL